MLITGTPAAVSFVFLPLRDFVVYIYTRLTRLRLVERLCGAR